MKKKDFAVRYRTSRHPGQYREEATRALAADDADVDENADVGHARRADYVRRLT